MEPCIGWRGGASGRRQDREAGCVQELAGKPCKPAQDVAFPRPFGPALPTTLLLVERIIPFFALVEPDVQPSQLLLQHVVYIFAVFGRVCEAARVAQSWRLLKG